MSRIYGAAEYLYHHLYQTWTLNGIDIFTITQIIIAYRNYLACIYHKLLDIIACVLTIVSDFIVFKHS